MTTPGPAAPVAATDVVELPLHPWAAAIAPTEAENVTVARSLLSEWVYEWEGNRAEIARLRAEVAELRARLAWVDQVYPATLPDGGARVEMTWVEFNAMREVIGLPPRKPTGRRR